MKPLFRLFCLLSILLLTGGCGKPVFPKNSSVMHTSINKILTTLDPVLAADMPCQYMTASFYDTPLQYNYAARPYRLEPSMLRAMPEIRENGTVYRCVLREDLLFQPSACFRSPLAKDRNVRASDVVFSIKRLADARLKSTGYWLVRGKIRGLDEFRRQTERAPANDLSPYDRPIEGFRILDDHTFEIVLTRPDPRFIYSLAMPYFSVVSRCAVEYWRDKFSDHPAGSGPFQLVSWRKDHQIVMKRNPEYRTEYFSEQGHPPRKLPLLDGIVCNFVKQPMAGWLMFLQGELDSYALDGENFAAVVNQKQELSKALRGRGIVLERAPAFETNYIGFLFTDPLLGKNANLRKAISLAFDKQKRMEFFSGRFQPAYGPVPPGADGYLENPGSYGSRNLERARAYMKLAGYADGIDPETGKPLELIFDQAGSDSFYRQTAELLALDLREIGIILKPSFNNRARFLQKLAQGQTQLFRLSWNGDYPDAENFFQLFYGPNAGASNRVCYQSAEYDRMYRTVAAMADTPERQKKYRELAEWITAQCPWIFETHPVSFLLKHSWLKNQKSHDFAFNRWKYYRVDSEERDQSKKNFKPLSMSELRN